MQNCNLRCCCSLEFHQAFFPMGNGTICCLDRIRLKKKWNVQGLLLRHVRIDRPGRCSSPSRQHRDGYGSGQKRPQSHQSGNQNASIGKSKQCSARKGFFSHDSVSYAVALYPARETRDHDKWALLPKQSLTFSTPWSIRTPTRASSSRISREQWHWRTCTSRIRWGRIFR